MFFSCQFRTVQVYIEDLRPAVAAGTWQVRRGQDVREAALVVVTLVHVYMYIQVSLQPPRHAP